MTFANEMYTDEIVYEYKPQNIEEDPQIFYVDENPVIIKMMNGKTMAEIEREYEEEIKKMKAEFAKKMQEIA